MPQLIAPAIATALGVSTATATTIATVGLYVTTVAAQYAISAALQPEPKVGTKVSIAFGGDVEQSVIIGTRESAGSLVYAGSYGSSEHTPNAFFVRVVCLSDMPIDGIRTPIWVNNEKYTIDWSTSDERGSPVPGLAVGGRDMFWVKYLDGSQTVADPYLRNKFGGADKPWKSTMIGRGRALAIITARYNKKEPENLPEVRFVCGGISFYNPKKDSTNGGSGSHRWNDRSTYEFDDNPGVVAYNLERGIYYNGKWMAGGRNLPAFLLDNDSFVASINQANDNIDLKGGGTEKRYRLGAEVSLASKGYDTLDQIRSTCNGRVSEAGGVLYFDSGSIGAADYSITDGDVVVTQSRDSVIIPSLSQRINTILGTYSEPDNGGDAKALKPKSNDDFVAQDDGQVLSASPQLLWVRSNPQGQRLINYMLRDNRRSRSHTIVLGPAFRALRSGKVINWTSEQYQYSNKKWIVGDVKLLASGLVVTSIREADPTDNEWDTSKQDDFVVGVYGKIVPASQALQIDVTPFGKKNRAGTQKSPAARITWSLDVDMVDCKRVHWQFKRVDDDDPDVDGQGTVDFDDGKAVIDGLVRDTDYKVRAKIIPYSDRDTDYGDWVTFTTGDYRLDDTDIVPGSLSSTKSKQRTKDYNGPGTITDTDFITVNVNNESGAAVKISWEWLLAARCAVTNPMTPCSVVLKATLWKKHGGGVKQKLATYHVTVAHAAGNKRDLTKGANNHNSKVFHDAKPKKDAVTTYGIDVVYKASSSGYVRKAYIRKCALNLSWNKR